MILINIDTTGNLKSVYSDSTKEILQSIGKVETKRASEVEPLANGKWKVDMQRIGLGIQQREFDLRTTAIEFEIAKINSVLHTL